MLEVWSGDRRDDGGVNGEMFMPYATTRDATRLYYEEAGSGSPILFVHEFAADYASWELQMRYLSRRHRCITYSARGYTPSDTPPGETFTTDNFRDDALAVLDHLGIKQAHFVGLSMGAYSALQVGLHRPERALSLTLAGFGTGSEPATIAAFRDSTQKNAQVFEKLGSAEAAKIYGKSPNRIPFGIKDPRGFAEFMAALARHDAQGSAHTQRGFQGRRPSVYDFEDGLRRLTLPVLVIVGDEDDPCIQPSLFLKRKIAASGLAMFPKTGHVVNLEEPALFNATLERFLTFAERSGLAARDRLRGVPCGSKRRPRPASASDYSYGENKNDQDKIQFRARRPLHG
jgi:3-oxoadipate enol-lactonase